MPHLQSSLLRRSWARFLIGKSDIRLHMTSPFARLMSIIHYTHVIKLSNIYVNLHTNLPQVYQYVKKCLYARCPSLSLAIPKTTDVPGVDIIYVYSHHPRPRPPPCRSLPRTPSRRRSTPRLATCAPRLATTPAWRCTCGPHTAQTYTRSLGAQTCNHRRLAISIHITTNQTYFGITFRTLHGEKF